MSEIAWCGEGAHGFKKCSKSQARSTETARSGSPRWGRQALCGIMPSCWSALCCLRWWSTNRSLEPMDLLPPARLSSSPKLLLAARIWPVIASLRHRNCFDIVRRARDVYALAEPNPATASKDETTLCIWWWYCLYLCSTFNQRTEEMNEELVKLVNQQISRLNHNRELHCIVRI